MGKIEPAGPAIMSNDSAQSLKKFASTIEGWLTEREGEFLYKLAKECAGIGEIVEIGSWKGKSTIWLGRGSKDGNNVKIHAIDPHTGCCGSQKKHDGKILTLEEFKRNIKDAGVDDVIVPAVKTSEEAANGWNIPIEILFIDGDHDYESVKKDFMLWLPHLIEGGIIAIHDSTSCIRALLRGWPGPRKVAGKFIFGSRNFKDVGVVDTITHARKCENNSPEDRIRMRFVRLQKCIPDLIQILWNASIRLRKPIRSAGERLQS